MAIRATTPTAGLRLWWNTDQDNTVWIEESTEIARSSFAATADSLVEPCNSELGIQNSEAVTEHS
jgi:hypothetical protein